MKQRRPYISVVIPAHNEQNYIKDTLKALKKQTYKNFETIVIADSCTDNTYGIARKFTKKVYRINESNVSISRNIGASHTIGDILVFLDADIKLTENSLEEIKKKFVKKYSVGTVRGAPEEKKFKYTMLYLYQNFVHKYKLYKQSAGVIICWRKTFEKFGGFNTTLRVLEDRSLILKMKNYGRYIYVNPATAVISMRRYEKEGFIRMGYFWLKTWLLSGTNKIKETTYKVVR